MTYPVFDTSGTAEAADLRMGPVTCSSCGCRLQHSEESESWFHFSPIAGRDARGCKVECADAPHDVRGRATQAIAA